MPVKIERIDAGDFIPHDQGQTPDDERAHQHAPCQRVDPAAFLLSVHPGTAGWEAAYEIAE